VIRVRILRCAISRLRLIKRLLASTISSNAKLNHTWLYSVLLGVLLIKHAIFFNKIDFLKIKYNHKGNYLRFSRIVSQPAFFVYKKSALFGWLTNTLYIVYVPYLVKSDLLTLYCNHSWDNDGLASKNKMTKIFTTLLTFSFVWIALVLVFCTFYLNSGGPFLGV